MPDPSANFIMNPEGLEGLNQAQLNRYNTLRSEQDVDPWRRTAEGPPLSARRAAIPQNVGAEDVAAARASEAQARQMAASGPDIAGGPEGGESPGTLDLVQKGVAGLALPALIASAFIPARRNPSDWGKPDWRKRGLAIPLALSAVLSNMGYGGQGVGGVLGPLIGGIAGGKQRYPMDERTDTGSPNQGKI
jgi:hypothetical protein